MGRVLVIGAGVVGLSAAVRLLEAGHRVDVLARDLPLETTSTVAAALWYPYRALPEDKVTAWSATTYAELLRIAEAEPGAGVVVRAGTEVFRAPTPDPWWADAVPGLARVRELPDGYHDGWRFAAPIVEMPVYLTWLGGRVRALGGTVTRHAVGRLPDEAGLVVNATGLGARLLADDRSVTPVRGQVVRLRQPGVEEWWLDGVSDSHGAPTYVVPRSHDVVVGGTDTEGDWSRTPDPATTADILRRATALVPALGGAEVLGVRVGLRPARPQVRVERVGDVVHCYGHGGAGVTLSWGTAAEVVRLVDS